MKRVLFNIYVPLKKEFESVANILKSYHKHYAKIINVDYISYDQIKEWKDIPFYDCINYCKYYYAQQLCENYDEVLYLDLDVIPDTKENFFDEFDFSKGILVKQVAEYNKQKLMHYLSGVEMAALYDEIGNLEEYEIQHACARLRGHLKYIKNEPFDVERVMYDLPEFNYTLPDHFHKWSDMVKWAGADSIKNESNLFNTGVLGFTKNTIQELNILSNMKPSKSIPSYWPDYITKHIGFNNESLFSASVKNYVDIGDKWNHFVNWNTDLWDVSQVEYKEACFKHFVNKDFEYYESNR